MNSSKKWAVDFILLGAVWGTSFLFMRWAVVEFGPLPTAGLRVAIAALFLLPLVWMRGLLPELKVHWRRTLLNGMFSSGIPFACISFALLSISTSLSAILNATVPIFGALIAWIWLRDKLNRSRGLGLVLGFVGVVMLAWDANRLTTGPGPNPSSTLTGWAVLACLVACLCYGLSASYTKRYLTGVKPMVIAAGSQIGATLGLALPVIWLWPAEPPGTRAWLSLLAVGVVCTALAYILFFRLIESAGPAKALAVTFLVPVFAVFYGVLLLGETVTLWMLLCGAIILCGTALSTGLLKVLR